MADDGSFGMFTRNMGRLVSRYSNYRATNL